MYNTLQYSTILYNTLRFLNNIFVLLIHLNVDLCVSIERRAQLHERVGADVLDSLAGYGV
eukprot:COSAG05_NODE_1309_length_5222_cov_9.690611_7_plen_60_part_00